MREKTQNASPSSLEEWCWEKYGISLQDLPSGSWIVLPNGTSTMVVSKEAGVITHLPLPVCPICMRDHGWDWWNLVIRDLFLRWKSQSLESLPSVLDTLISSSQEILWDNLRGNLLPGRCIGSIQIIYRGSGKFELKKNDVPKKP